MQYGKRNLLAREEAFSIRNEQY